ncbi:unnamed protein product, partial [Notodromas monacha]
RIISPWVNPLVVVLSSGPSNFSFFIPPGSLASEYKTGLQFSPYAISIENMIIGFHRFSMGSVNSVIILEEGSPPQLRAVMMSFIWFFLGLSEFALMPFFFHPVIGKSKVMSALGKKRAILASEHRQLITSIPGSKRLWEDSLRSPGDSLPSSGRNSEEDDDETTTFEDGINQKLNHDIPYIGMECGVVAALKNRIIAKDANFYPHWMDFAVRSGYSADVIVECKANLSLLLLGIPIFCYGLVYNVNGTYFIDMALRMNGTVSDTMTIEPDVMYITNPVLNLSIVVLLLFWLNAKLQQWDILCDLLHKLQTDPVVPGQGEVMHMLVNAMEAQVQVIHLEMEPEPRALFIRNKLKHLPDDDHSWIDPFSCIHYMLSQDNKKHIFEIVVPFHQLRAFYNGTFVDSGFKNMSPPHLRAAMMSFRWFFMGMSEIALMTLFLHPVIGNSLQLQVALTAVCLAGFLFLGYLASKYAYYAERRRQIILSPATG